MRSQTYGDKQREAQQRKKQEELRKKANPEEASTPETPVNPSKTKKKDTSGPHSTWWQMRAGS